MFYNQSSGLKNIVTKQSVALLGIKNWNFTTFNFKNRFWYYDLLFLDVLIDSKGKGSKVFSDLFKNNDPIRIFKFLDEKTSFTEELSIFLSVNVVVFVKSLIKRISNFSI